MLHFFDLIVLILTATVCLLTFFKWKFSYWRNKRVSYIEPQIPFGTSENPFNRKTHTGVVIQNQYLHFKSQGDICGGLYTFVRPSLLLVDLELIRNVMSKDFNYFTDRGVYYNEKSDPLSCHLFSLEGNKWRSLRAKLTPTFTSGKLKMMFPTLLKCGEPLYNAVNESSQKNVAVEVKDVFGRFTTDVIGSCAFGLECNSFKEPEGDFRKYSKMAFKFSSKLQVLKGMIALSYPEVGRFLGISVTNTAPKRFFLEVVKETVSFREVNGVVRNDFMQLLMHLRNGDTTDQGLTIQQVAAQAFVFFIAGFETSSTTMTFCLFELARNQHTQDKLRNEIDTTLKKHGGNLTYDAVIEMKNLDQAVQETLRKYPPLATIPRICVQDYQLPETDIIIEKGTRIIIPVYALQNDPEYFPNPEKFDPERFSDDNKARIRPFSYIPFGEGPRICIGLRFGLMQAKVGLTILLQHFKFSLNNKTKVPLEFDQFNFTLSPKGGIWLDVEAVPCT